VNIQERDRRLLICTLPEVNSSGSSIPVWLENRARSACHLLVKREPHTRPEPNGGNVLTVVTMGANQLSPEVYAC
jgi:hypothetical protein